MAAGGRGAREESGVTSRATPTAAQRYAAFRAWCRSRDLTDRQGLALTTALVRLGFYLQLDETGGARLRLKGGSDGPELLYGFMVLHGRDSCAEER